MGLTSWLTLRAVSGAHVLVVETPGGWSTRVAVEQAIGRRGWQTAVTPADADVLLVCGQPGPGLAAAIDRVWDQIPGPRARVSAPCPETAIAVLEQAEAILIDHVWQSADADRRQAAGVTGVDAEAEMAHEGMGHGDMDHDGMSDGGMSHSDTDRGQMEMEMAGPGGVALAGGGPDRDGLEMDVLHLPLGPILNNWPPGLVLRCSLQGDVVVEAEVDIVDSGHDVQPIHPMPSVPVRLDAAIDVLVLAGWESMAAEMRRVRDALLDDSDPVRANAAVALLRARIVRSRLLRWSLRGLGRVDDAGITEHHLPEHSAGDVYDRLMRMVAPPTDLTITDTESAAVLAAIPKLVKGYDVAAVRLIVASHAPLPSNLVPPVHQGGEHA